MLPADDFPEHAPTEASAASEASDAAAFEALYRRWWYPLVRLCRSHLRGRGDAEAVAQEAFVRAWGAWRSYAPDRPFWPWLATIGRRLCINEVDSELRRACRLDRASLLDGPPAEDDTSEAMARQSAVDEVLGQLSERQRRLLILRYFEGWSYDEIAAFHGVTRESVRAGLKRARATFRRIYDTGPWSALGGVGAVLRQLADLRSRGSRALHAATRWAFHPMQWGDNTSAVAALVLAVMATVTASPTHGPVVGASAPGIGIGPSTEVQVVSAPASPGAHSHDGTPPPRASRRGEASPASPAMVADVADALAPEDGTGYQFTPSPSYGTDTTVFAMGKRSNCSSAALCPLLFRSSDGGASWHARGAEGLPLGMSYRILLPPAFPRDHRVFAVSLAAVFVSDDGGDSFRMLTPAPGAPAMSPLFSAGDPRILFGSPNTLLRPQLPTQYHDGTGVITPLLLPLPADATPVSFAFSPAYATDGRMLVTVLEARGPGASGVSLLPQMSTYSCSATACARAMESAGQQASVLWSTSAPELVFVWDSWSLHRSRDGGRSFTPITFPGGPREVLHLLRQDADGRMLAGTVEHPHGALYASDD
ncbi:MAG TPA: sigma-70 family RNA polymerase sigma factor, partial [Acidimicrobiales bacterium]